MHRTIPWQRLKLLPPSASANAMARILGLPQPTLLYWIRRLRAPAVKQGNSYRIDRETFTEWLKAKRRLKF